MIYLLSDPHGEDNLQGLKAYLSFCQEEDLLILLGDLELNFRDTETNKEFTHFFLFLTCNIAFLDGNHENFDDLYRQPQEESCGGLVHRITPHIVHLMRGEIYEIEGRSIFTMGGYKSNAKWQNSALW